MKKFEFFDVTADIGFYAYGNNLNEAFENAGLALFNIISKTDNINPITSKSFEITSETKLTSAPKPPTISSNILETDFLLCIFNYLTIIHYICFHKSTIAESFTAFPSTIFIL